ncbi:MAG: HIT family protein [Candidatus Falkowbacteria bacterium]
MDCIFCKIINGDIPKFTVYEDDDSIAFLDVSPVNPGHVLVLPKKHVANFEEVSEEILTATMKTVKKVGKSLKDSLGVAGYNVYENNDPVAGQVIHHLHFHVIPRHEGDELGLWPQKKYEPGQAEEILNKIKIN